MNTVSFKIDLLDNAKGTLQSLKGNFEGVESAVNDVTEGVRRSDGAFDEFAQTAFKFNQVTEVFDGLNNVINTLTSGSRDFEEGMLKANTMANLGAKEFDNMKDSVRGLSREIPIARDMLADGLYQVISNGVPENNWIDFLESSARSAVGGVAELGNVVTVTSTLIKNYGLEWDAALGIQDKIQNTARYGVTSFEQLGSALPRVSGNAATLGIEIDDLLASFATLTGVSGNTAEVSTQLAAIFSSMIRPSSEAAKMAEEMGISFNAMSIKEAGGIVPFLQNLERDVAAYTQSTGMLKENVYATLFGSAEAMRAIIPLTGQLAGDFEEKAGLIRNSAGTIDAAFDAMNSSTNAYSRRINNFFQSIGDLVHGFVGKWGVVLQALSSGAVILAQLGGAVSTLGKIFKGIFTINIIGSAKGSIVWFKRMGRVFRLQMAFLKADMISGSMATLGFRGNIVRASLALMRFGTVGVLQAVKGLGALVLSFVTAGAASVKFKAISVASFTAFKLSAITSLRAVSVAIMNVPIIGWIAAIIAGLIGLGVYLYKTSDKFKAVLTGMFGVIKTFFTSIYDMAKNIFGGVYDLISGAFTMDIARMKKGLTGIKDTFVDFGGKMAQSYNEGYNRVMDEAAEKRRNQEAEKGAEELGISVEQYKKLKSKADAAGVGVEEYIQNNPMAVYGGGDGFSFDEPGLDDSDPYTPVSDDPISENVNTKASASIGGGGASVKQVHIHIESLIGENTNMFSSTDSIEDAHDFTDRLTRVLQLAINDVSV